MIEYFKYAFKDLLFMIALTMMPGMPVPAQPLFGSLDLADYSGDGLPDLLFCNNMNNGISGIAVNDGTGEFEFSGLPARPTATSLGWRDLNNDGFLDYFLFGSGPGNAGIYFSDGAGSASRSAQFDGFNWLDPDVSVTDYDLDGDLDLFLSGWDVASARRYSRMFRNDGRGNFTETDLSLVEKGYGSSAWADVDGDGYPDLLLNGDGDAYGDNGSYDIYRLYLNDGNGGFTEKQVFQDYRQISVGDGSRFVDWDNDGDFDIILTGWSNTESRQATCLFLNDGSGNFTRSSESDLIPGVSESSIEVADMNRDGRIDLFLTGYSGDYGRRVALLYLNETPALNTRPDPPSILHTMAGTDSVVFSWDAGSDAETTVNSLSYNLSLKDITNDRWIIHPGSVTEGSDKGLRTLAGAGNVFMNRSWTIYGLPVASYAWSVQTIDAGYSGSVFAEEVVFAVKDTAYLRELISQAEQLLATAEEGFGVGQYRPGSMASLRDTIDRVEPWITEPEKTQDQIETPLLQALAAFHAARTGVDVSGLDEAITEAENTLLEAEIGEKNGMYPQAAADQLDLAILDANVARDSALSISDTSQIGSMQNLVSAETDSMITAIDEFRQQEIVVDFTILEQLIDSAILVYETTPEGNNNGSYPAEARLDLALAIEQAVAVRKSQVSRQEVDAAVAQLYLDLDTYYGRQVTVRFEELGTLIDSANAIHDTAQAEHYEPGAKFDLRSAISEAEFVHRNPSATQQAVDAAITEMQDAITRFLDARLTGTLAFLSGRWSIYPNPARDRLIVDGLPAGARVVIYTLRGKIVYSKIAEGDRLSFDLSGFVKGPVLVRINAGPQESLNRILIIQ